MYNLLKILIIILVFSSSCKYEKQKLTEFLPVLSNLSIDESCCKDSKLNDEIKKAMHRSAKIRDKLFYAISDKIFVSEVLKISEVINTNGLSYKILLYTDLNGSYEYRSEYPHVIDEKNLIKVDTIIFSSENVPCCSENLGLDNRFITNESQLVFQDDEIHISHNRLFLW